MNRTLRTATALALIAATTTGQQVHAAVPTPASGTTWAPNQAVQYRWRDGNVPPAWMRPAINSAADDANDSRAARAAVLSYHENGASWVAYTPDIPSTYAIGFAVRNVPDSFTVRLRPHGYRLDWGTLKWCQFYDNPPQGCYDAEMVALHEFGHVQTLGHVDESAVAWLDSVMHAAVHSKAKTGWNMHAFGRCDVARLQIRYGPLTSRTPYSTCLDVATELSFGASSTSPPYLGNVTFSATLRVSPQAQYAQLAGEPLSGRSVLLQRRTPGSSSWSTFVEMVPLDSGGDYVRTVRIGATYDWRAVFVSPADEGLGGSSSGAVRVTAGECTSNCPLHAESTATTGGAP